MCSCEQYVSNFEVEKLYMLEKYDTLESKPRINYFWNRAKRFVLLSANVITLPVYTIRFNLFLKYIYMFSYRLKVSCQLMNKKNEFENHDESQNLNQVP